MQSSSKKTQEISFGQRIQNNQWFILISITIVAFLLGYVGFHRSFQSASMETTPFDLIYLSIQLFVLQSGAVVPVTGWELQVARFLAPAVTFFSLFLFLFILFQEKIKRSFLRFARDHVIICGRSEIGSSLSRNFSETGYKVVIIDSGKSYAGKRLQPQSQGICVYDDPTIQSVHNEIAIDNARYLFVVDDDDGINLEISSLLPTIMKTPRECPLYCFIHQNSAEMTNLLREQQFFTESNKNLRIEYFNIYQLAGWTLIRDFSPFPADSVDINPIHVMILGLGRMGESVVVQLVKKWKNVRKESTQKITITVIDRVARRKISWMTTKYQSLTEYAEIIPLEMEIESSEFLEGQFLINSGSSPSLSMIYCCFGDHTLNIIATLQLRKLISSCSIRKEKFPEIPIIVRTSSEMGFNRIIQEKSSVMNAFRDIHLFPYIDRTCSPDVIHYSDFELVARAIHEDYVQQQLKSGRMMDSDNKDPESPMKPWDKLSESLKASNREQASDIRNKLSMIGCEIFPATRWDEPLFEFTNEELEKLSIQEHNRWMQEKLRKGWKYGPIRDNDEKIHNCLVPWEELPEHEKEKDRDAVRAIPLLLQKVDLLIRRVR